MYKQNTEEARGFSNEDLDLLAYLLAGEGIELEQTPVIQRRAPNAEVPLSFAQQRLWFLDQLQPGNPVYNLPTAVRVSGCLDVSALEKTFSEIVRRHEILRTTFITIDGSPWQIIAPATPVSFPVVDLSKDSSEDHEAEIRRLTHEEVVRPFDLSNGPLMRILLIRLSDNEHIVIVTMHHIVSDGWSSGILVHEIGVLYQEFTTDRPSRLAELPLQYGDYALWQRELMQGEKLSSQLDYWRSQLHDLQALSLPLDHPRPAAQTFRGARQTVVVPRAIGDALKEIGQTEQATLFMVLLAAFASLLSRYSGQTDITIGTPIANRPRAELEPLIGFFANTLVLRLNTADCSFRELVGRARKICLEAYAHQDLPFEKLVEELQPERSLSHTPLFQTMLVLQNVPRGELNLEGLRMEGLPADTGTAKFDLVLVVNETEQGFVCTLEYNTDLFEKETIERLLGQFRTLSGGAATNPDLSLAALPLLNEVERRELLAKWAGTGEDYRRAENLHQLFEEQVVRTPKAVAVSFEQEQLTYAELNARANRLAHYLRAQGVGPETLVALCVDRSPEMVVAILGVLKAGGAYVPLEPANPKERLAFMLEDSRAPILLTENHLLNLLSDFGGTIITLDADQEFLLEQNEENPCVTAMAENTAYVIYTSGSTGRPKGTHITHSNVIRLFASTQQWFDFGDTDVWTLFHSYAFDFSVWEIWGALLYGGRLVVVPYWTSRTPEDFYELLDRERVTILNQTPLAFRQLIRAEEQYSSELVLRLIIFGGEALEPISLKPWIDRHGDEQPQLVNMYGITETTVHVTYRRLLRSDIEGTTGSVIGVPLPDLQVYVLDQMLEPVPTGATGEMYVGGEGVARGYLGRAELTADRFVPHPFSATPGSRLYKTGDLGRYLYTGELEYAGRCDQQVKIRGFRIELGEIQAVLSAHLAVRDAVVISLPDSDGERRLVAYVTLREAVAIDQLRAFIREQLPDHMIPAAFVVLDELPITPNGKLDRRALPTPEAARLAPQDSYLAPRTEIEELLASIWADVLNLEQVGVTDSFFALGGDSIRSVRVLAKARERGLEFSLQQLFRHQTIAELAREIAVGDTQSLPLQETKPFELISQADRDKLPPGVVDAYPVTMMQGGMFFHMALAPDTSVYHNINSWHLRAPFDRKYFEESVGRAVARHPILRTAFDLTTYSEPLQLVHESATLQVGVTDLRQYSEEEQGELLDQYVESEKSHLFDLGCPPLLRFHIHLRTPESFQFTLTESHPIFDGWSLNSTLAEIFTNYFTLLKEHTLPPIAPLAITFRDFVLMERQALESEEFRNFWEERLRGFKVTRLPRLPASYHQPRGQRIREEHVQISPEICSDLDAVARSLKVPIKSVLLAAHQKVLSLLSGETDVVTGLVTNGRPEARDGEEVRGMFLNTLPFRLGISDGTWADLILSTFKAESELLPYRRYPLVALQRQMGGQPLFEAQFTFIRFHVLERVLRSGDVEVLPDSKRRAAEETHFLLSADFMQSVFSSQVSLMLQYDSSELSEEQVRAIAGYYLETLQRIAADPAERHNARTSITPAERRRLLIEWNDNSGAYSRGACLHELFEAQVERTPNSVAVTSDEVSLTYCELNERANQLTHFLQSLGIGPDARVAVLLERSVEMVVALLGILKAGGAYVPLDPNYHEEHLRLMLADCGATVLLTNSRLAVPDKSGPLVVHLDSDFGRISQQSVSNLTSGVTPDNLAYIIYKSGSTGRPKGVAIEHGSATAFMNWASDVFDRKDLQGVLFSTSIGLDLSIFELFLPLSSGGRIILADNALQLTELPAAAEVTLINTVPSAMTELLRLRAVPDSVRVVNLAGEPLREELVAEIYATTQVERVYNLYGLTENTTYSTCTLLRSGEHVTIGRPVANTRVYILDEQMEPVPVGVTGELYIGGDGLARGYHQRAGLTAEKFIPDPFGQEAGARLYRTGDLARYLPDGLVEFRGRADFELKLRGMPSNGQQPASPAAFVAPRNELERTLAHIWSEVLGVEQIGIHDNFFDLGGHSVRLLQMHLKIRETMQRELPLFELFQYPTINALANHLQTGGDGESLAPSEQRGERRKQQSAQQRQRRQAIAR